MTGDEICFASAVDLAAAIRARRLSPVEVVRAVLDRIEALEPQLHAFATLTAERALTDARVAEAAVMRGETLGLLHGVPITLKDLTLTAGIPTQRGSRIHEGFIPDTDAPFVTRVRAAGAIVLGKTTTPEFGWKGVSHSPLTGITSNPWRAGYNAGASSAGAGAAAAAGYGPLHQGSDGAGSIRMPAHFCGVFGLKPTFGRIPYWPVPNNDQTSHVGPLTRTVADAALFLNATAGAHPLDHTSQLAPSGDFGAGLADGVAGLRVAFSPDLGHARVDADVAALVASAVQVFADLGAHVETVDVPHAAHGPELVRFFWPVHETPLAVHLARWQSQMDPGLVACIEAGLGHSALTYLQMRARKLAYVEQWQRLLQRYDLLLTPAVSVAAFPAHLLQPEHWPQHAWDWLMWAEFSHPFNMSGQPAASVPCGFTAETLPVGLQIVGARGQDALVLRAAAAFEAARPWTQRRPPH